MKNFNIKGTLFLLTAILFLGMQSCAKSKAEKNLAGTWNIDNITFDGVDFVDASEGMSISGSWTFSECSDGTCDYAYSLTVSVGEESSTDTGASTYEVIDKETLRVDSEEFVIEELTSSSLILSITDGEELKYYMSK